MLASSDAETEPPDDDTLLPVEPLLTAAAGTGTIAVDEAFEQVARRSERQRCAGIRPIFQPNERLGAFTFGIEAAECLVLADCSGGDVDAAAE